MNKPPLRAAAVADDPVAAEAAEDYLLGGGSALGAVAAGFFAAAGAFAGVLLSPVSIIVAGVGLGTRAFDGRLRQPGLGTKRPRGFLDKDEVPDAAAVAVPAGVAAILVALAYDDAGRLARLMKSGIRRAKDSGAVGRATLLERIRSIGARALTEPTFTRPMLHVAGPAQGGLLTSADFGKLTGLDQDALERESDGHRLVFAPWAFDEDAQTIGSGHAVCAVDARGVMAALSYRRVLHGIALDELDLEAPLAAVPVRRGVPRVAPGTSLPAPAPISIVLADAGMPVQVRCWPTEIHPPSAFDAQPVVGLRVDRATHRVESIRPR